MPTGKSPPPAEPGAGAAFRCGRVAIIGRPNVGKSTLMNALVGARVSITSRKPQTTRQRVAGILTTGAAQFIFVDTPGFQNRHRSGLNERMNRSVRDALAGVDAIVVVLEALKLDDADRRVLALLPADAKVVVAINKIDRIADKARLLPFLQELAELFAFAALVPVSAEKSLQLDRLLEAIAPLLPEAPPVFESDELTDRDERFLAAEFIREKIFRLLGDEVPYQATVAIETFEHEGDLRRIRAIVYVDRDNQRAMLLGHDGKRMKEIASGARRDMEQLFGGKVFLEVWVSVKSGWANDERMLDRLGF